MNYGRREKKDTTGVWIREHCYILVALFLAMQPVLVAVPQQMSVETELVRRMLEIVTDTSGALHSQEDLVAVTASVPLPKAQTGLTGISLGATGSWSQPEEPDNESSFTGGGSLTFTFSLRDPSWPQNRTNLEQNRTAAIQEEEAIRAELIASLFGSLEQLVAFRVEHQRLDRLYEELQGRLRQITTGTVVVNIEQLWQIEERILTIESEIANSLARMEQLELRIAIEQGGERWVELLRLLREWNSGVSE